MLHVFDDVTGFVEVTWLGSLMVEYITGSRTYVAYVHLLFKTQNLQSVTFIQRHSSAATFIQRPSFSGDLHPESFIQRPSSRDFHSATSIQQPSSRDQDIPTADSNQQRFHSPSDPKASRFAPLTSLPLT